MLIRAIVKQLIGGQSSLSKVNIVGTVCVFVWSSIIVLLCAFQGPRLAHGYHIKCLCEGCFQFLGCHWLIHWHSSLLSLFGSWIFIPKSCLYIDRCVLFGHSTHFQPHKQAACVVKKVFLPSYVGGPAKEDLSSCGSAKMISRVLVFQARFVCSALYISVTIFLWLRISLSMVLRRLFNRTRYQW